MKADDSQRGPRYIAGTSSSPSRRSDRLAERKPLEARPLRRDSRLGMLAHAYPFRVPSQAYQVTLPFIVIAAAT